MCIASLARTDKVLLETLSVNEIELPLQVAVAIEPNLRACRIGECQAVTNRPCTQVPAGSTLRPVVGLKPS